MSQKWTRAIVSCPGCASYMHKGFYIRRGQELPVDDKKLAQELREINVLNVADVFEEEETAHTKKGK